MVNKKKIIKAIIAVMVFFSFALWGLDPEFICKIASTAPQTCGYEQSAYTNALGTGFRVMLTVMAGAMLVKWARIG